MVIELRLGLTWLVVGVAVALVQAARSGVLSVDVDLKQVAAVLAALPLAGFSNAVPTPRPRSAGTT